MDFNYYTSPLNGLNAENFESPNENNMMMESNDLSVFIDDKFFDFEIGDFATEEIYKATKEQAQQQIKVEEQSVNLNDVDFQNFLNGQLSLNNHSTGSSPIAFSEQQHHHDYQQQSAQSIRHHSISSDSKISKDYSLEDKRKRNTLASARFRMKKKMKEQMMEETLNDLSSKVNDLKSLITKLEMENKCLKSLIISKNERKSEDLLLSIKRNATYQ